MVVKNIEFATKVAFGGYKVFLLLFLDEPTSGLDSAASFEVISFVKDIAKKHNVSSAWMTIPALLSCTNHATVD